MVNTFTGCSTAALAELRALVAVLGGALAAKAGKPVSKEDANKAATDVTNKRGLGMSLIPSLKPEGQSPHLRGITERS
jgi:hypothetical protein